jgi:hypothetical protein
MVVLVVLVVVVVLVVFLHSMLRLLVTANVVSSSPIIVIGTMEAIRSSETSIPTRATRRHIPEEGILHCPICFLLPLFSHAFW